MYICSYIIATDGRVYILDFIIKHSKLLFNPTGKLPEFSTHFHHLHIHKSIYPTDLNVLR